MRSSDQRRAETARISAARSAVLLAGVLLLSAACGGKDAAERGAMRPVEPPPGRTSTATTTVGENPMITTAGSPNPYEHAKANFEPVVIGNGEIRLRKSLPAINLPFRITNRDRVQHVLQLEGSGGDVAARGTTIPPSSEVVVVARLTDRNYTIRCVQAGHDERASFATYVPR